MGIDDKGGEIGQRYDIAWGEVVQKEEQLDLDIDQEGVRLKNVRGSKFLDKEKHTSRGSKLMNFD